MMATKDEKAIATAIQNVLVSPNEWDRNGEAANLVDALFFIGRAIHRLADVLDHREAERGTSVD
jgi:hypothetical protein